MHHTIAALLAIAIVAVPPAAAQAPGETSLAPRNFELRTAGDLLALCTTEPSATDHLAARAFCYGFVSGGLQYHDEVSSAESVRPIVCPDRPLTRDDIVAVFTQHVRRTPAAAEERPIDAVFRALAARWPCGRAAPRAK